MTRHTYQCRVRFSDVDVYGHVNNVKYFEYYQEARIAFMTELVRADLDVDLSLVLARVSVSYRRPILFRTEPYTIETWVTRVGSSSFGLAAEIKDGDALLSRAEAVMVSFDVGSQSSRPLSGPERDRLREVVE